jgi:hypothetical protein
VSAAPATLDTTEVDALKDEVARYRLALHAIATLGGTMALHAKTPTAAAGFSHLSGLASDALEQI